MSKDLYQKTLNGFNDELDLLGEKMTKSQRQKIKNSFKNILPQTSDVDKILQECQTYMNGKEKAHRALYNRFLNELLKAVDIKNTMDPKYDDFEEKYGLADDDYVNLMIDTYYRYMEDVLDLYDE